MWPFNSKAAISITYDDGHDSNLDLAIPDLEDRGLRGTFFLTPALFRVIPCADAWRQACRRGHEIGNHTWDHPCAQLRNYLSEDFEREQTGKTEQWLNDHVGLNGVPGIPDDLRTYAYICAEERLGPGDDQEARARYRKLVEETFWAGRSGGGGPTTRTQVLANPQSIPAQALTYGYRYADRCIDYCQQAAATDGWAVLIFHDIVEREPQIDTETTREVHSEILDHLYNNRDKYWVAPFREVFRHILSGG